MEVDSGRGLRAPEELGDLRRRPVLEVVQGDRRSLLGGEDAEGAEEVGIETARVAAARTAPGIPTM